jgi:GspL periplasmic domain
LNHLDIVSQSSATSIAEFGKLRLLILPSEKVFVVPISDPVSKLADQQLRYELESDLLIDAESVVCDIHSHSSGSIALIADGSSVLVDALDSTIGLTARVGLVIQGYLGQRDPSSTRIDPPNDGLCFLISNPQSESICDVVVIQQQTIVGWRYCAIDQASTICHELFESLAKVQISKIVCIGIESAVAEKLAGDNLEMKEYPFEFCELKPDDLQAQAAKAILQGTLFPLVNLTGPILPTVNPLKPAVSYGYLGLASVLLFALLVMAGLIYRASLYRAESVRLVAEQESLFRELFPGQKLPVGLTSRFRSELRRLRLTKGSESRPEVKNVLPVFHQFLVALPSESEVRFQIQNMRFEESSLTVLGGNVATTQDLDNFRQSLERVGFSLPPISSRLGPQGVPLQWSNVVWTSLKDSNEGGKP